MLGGEDEEWESLVKVLSAPHGSNPIRIAIRQEILCVRMSPICQTLQQRRCLFDQLLPLVRQSRGFQSAAGDGPSLVSVGGCDHALCRVDHKDRKLKHQFRVVCLFRILSIEIERPVVGEQRGLLARAEVGWGIGSG